MPTTRSYAPIRPSDLADPTLNKLNTKLQQLTAALGGATTSGLGGVQSYTPNLTGAGLTLTAVGAKRAQYAQVGSTVSLSLDMTLSVAGSAATLTVSLPVLPDSYTAGTALACALLSGGTLYGGVAILQNAALLVGLASGATLPTGAIEILIGGSYQAA